MATSNLIPHSFVLADLFDVESMCLDVPDHILEDDHDLEWITCPTCHGERWLEVHDSPYRDAALAWGRPDLIKAFTPCLRCQDGEVLEPVAARPRYTEDSEQTTWKAAA